MADADGAEFRFRGGLAFVAGLQLCLWPSDQFLAAVKVYPNC